MAIATGAMSPTCYDQQLIVTYRPQWEVTVTYHPQWEVTIRQYNHKTRRDQTPQGKIRNPAMSHGNNSDNGTVQDAIIHRPSSRAGLDNGTVQDATIHRPSSKAKQAKSKEEETKHPKGQSKPTTCVTHHRAMKCAMMLMPTPCVTQP